MKVILGVCLHDTYLLSPLLQTWEATSLANPNSNGSVYCLSSTVFGVRSLWVEALQLF